MSEQVKDRICNCPSCRYGRGELTDKEYAWYVKGCIQKETAYLNIIRKATSLQSLLHTIHMNDYNVDCGYADLENLNKNGLLDPAFEHPECLDYTEFKENKNVQVQK